MKNLHPTSPKKVNALFSRDALISQIQVVVAGSEGLKYAVFSRSYSTWAIRKTNTALRRYGRPVGLRYVFGGSVSDPELFPNVDPSLRREAASLFLRVDERTYRATGQVWKTALAA